LLKLRDPGNILREIRGIQTVQYTSQTQKAYYMTPTTKSIAKTLFY